jgi:hypothetical protein
MVGLAQRKQAQTFMLNMYQFLKDFADLVLGALPMTPILQLFLQLHAPAPLVFSQQNLQFGHAASSGRLSHRFQQNASSAAPLIR